jgi:hypothetical protein
LKGKRNPCISWHLGHISWETKWEEMQYFNKLFLSLFVIKPWSFFFKLLITQIIHIGSKVDLRVADSPDRQASKQPSYPVGSQFSDITLG